MSEFDPLPAMLEYEILKYRSWIDENLKNTQLSQLVTRPLSHYTDAEGLKGIIENGSIYFTDVRYLNDPSEFKFGMNLVKLVINNYINNKNNYNINEFLRFSISNLDSIISDNLFYYVSCFSELRDDLNHWRTYGADGRGYSVVFSEKFFEIKNSDGASPGQNNDLGLHSYVLPINYDEQKSTDYYKSTIEMSINIIDKVIKNSNNYKKDKIILNQFARRIYSLMILDALWCVIVNKHPAYATEKEVRKFIIENKESVIGHLKTRTRGSEIIPYISADQPVYQEDMIAEIIVGPAADQRAVDAVKALLLSKNMNWVKVSKSNVPYRSVYQPINSLDELGPFGSL